MTVGDYTVEGSSLYEVVTFRLGRFSLETSCHGLVGLRLTLCYGRRDLLGLYAWGRKTLLERFVHRVWEAAERTAFGRVPSDSDSVDYFDVRPY